MQGHPDEAAIVRDYLAPHLRPMVWHTCVVMIPYALLVFLALLVAVGVTVHFTVRHVSLAR
jgi:hypothetical protein